MPAPEGKTFHALWRARSAMTDGRQTVLDSIARALRREGPDEATRNALERRLSDPKRNLIPARGQLAPEARVALFVEMAREAAATLVRLPSTTAVPAAVADYLRHENLPPQIPHRADAGAAKPALARVADARSEQRSFGGPRSCLAHPRFRRHRRDRHVDADLRPSSPTTLNFLPDAHIVVLRAEQIVGALENAWTLLRKQHRRRDHAANGEFHNWALAQRRYRAESCNSGRMDRAACTSC
jgi:L-lactate dehydrogenase complex protein LldG